MKKLPKLHIQFVVFVWENLMIFMQGWRVITHFIANALRNGSKSTKHVHFVDVCTNVELKK